MLNVICLLCLFVIFLIIEITKSVVKEAFMEIEKEKEVKSLTFSSANSGIVSKYLLVHNLLLSTPEEILLSTVTADQFNPFHWNENETEDFQTPRACKHLSEQLVKYGVTFGRSGYFLYDVHKCKNLLSVTTDVAFGKLSGGTDCIIAPYGLALESTPGQACVVFEFKTANAISSTGFEDNLPQAVLELLCACYYSNQPCLAVLTDMWSGAVILKIGGNGRLIQRYELSLHGMALMISQHLKDTCVADRVFSLPTVVEQASTSSACLRDLDRENMINFKKLRTKQTVDWEEILEPIFMKKYPWMEYPLPRRLDDESWRSMYT